MRDLIGSLLYGADRMPIDEAKALVRSLRVTLLGVETDAQEALSPYRTERSIRDVRAGIQDARRSVDQLLELLSSFELEPEKRSQNGNAQAGVLGA